MELQFFDQNGQHCLTLRQVDPLYPSLVRSFVNTPYHQAFLNPKEDFHIVHKHLPVVLANLRHELEVQRDHIGAELAPDILGDSLSEVTILEEPLLLYLRDPLHAQLLRLNKMFLHLNQVEKMGRDVQVLIVPDLSSIEYHILRILKNARDGLQVTNLHHMLEDEYKRLAATEILTHELQESMEKDLQEIQQTSVLERLLIRLQQWQLLQNDVKGQTVVGTAKLFRIRL